MVLNHNFYFKSKYFLVCFVDLYRNYIFEDDAECLVLHIYGCVYMFTYLYRTVWNVCTHIYALNVDEIIILKLF